MSRRIRAGIGVLLSLLLLVWALRDVSFEQVLLQLRGADLLLLAASIVVALAGFWIRAARWGILLIPVQRGIAFRPRLAATFIGFAANNVLPARIGEFARAFVLARLAPIRTSSVFATLVVERLLDALVLVGLLFAAMAAPGFPAAVRVGGVDLRAAALSLALAMALVAVGLFVGAARPRFAGRIVRIATRILPTRLRAPTYEGLRSFGSGLAVMRNPLLFAVSLLLALGQWLFLALSFLLGFRAFGIDEVPFSAAVFLQSLISLAVAIPASPGFFGPFEAAARIGLGLWAVPADLAISFAIGFHIAGYVPVTLIGFFYVWRLNLSWSDVRHSDDTVESELHAGGATYPTTAEPTA
jgi:glycosyltransferase 2 family protein